MPHLNQAVWLIALSLLFSLPIGGQAVDRISTETGAWPLYRGDTRLTGRALLPGDMSTAPVVAWQYAIAAGEVWAAVDVAPGSSSATIVAPQQFTPSHLRAAEDRQWGLGPRLVDLYGNGQWVPDPGRAAKLLPDVAGLQTIEFPLVADAPGTDPRQVVCYAHEAGQKREVWRSETFDTVQNTNFVVADIDGDGLLEVAFAPHYRVIVLDGQSGRTKHLLKMHDLRNYGFFCTTDVDGDGLLDFVVIADFAMHIDVVKNEGDQLKLLWRRDIEQNIQSKSRIVRPGPNPVLDLNGDGRLEIVFNLFNEQEDGQWHVVAYDALSGETVLDLPQQYLHGSADVNGDGVAELFVSRSAELLVPTSAELSLLRVHGSEAIPLWQHAQGQWLTAATDLAPTHSTIVARGSDDVMTASLTAQGGRGFFVRETRDDRTERLRAFVLGAGEGTDGRAQQVWSLDLPTRSRLQWRAAADVDGDGVDEVLVSYRQAQGTSAELGAAEGAEISALRLERTGAAGTAGTEGTGIQKRPVAVVVGEQQPTRIIFEGAHHDIVALEPPQVKGESAILHWRIAGAGPAIFADVNGDGVPEVVYADQTISGEGEMVAVDLYGKSLWRQRVVGFPGPHPPWNFGGITSWWVGRYSEKDRDDIWVSARRSTMHSDEAWVLRGSDGESLWHLREVRTDQTGPDERGWGAGGSFVASADVDGDGLEDIVGLYPVNYMAARGASGELIHSVSAVSGLFEGVWGAYCQPLVIDVDGDGVEELLWCGPYHHGLTTLDASVLWYHAGGAGMAGVGDVDGDGRLELGISGWEKGEGLRCLDAASGVEKWQWPLADNARVAVYSADIDGDGRDEFLFVVEQTLYAVGERNGAAQLVWELELPTAPGDLSLADVDGDGKIEILFIGEDSVLYCLDSAR